MGEFIVRLWVDIKVKADDADGAKHIAKTGSFEVILDNMDPRVLEIYDTQVSGEAWAKE